MNQVDKLTKFYKNGTPAQKVGVAVVGTITTLYTFNKLIGNNPLGKTATMFRTFWGQEKTRNVNVNEMIDGYDKLHSGDTADDRNMSYTQLVNSYYELATLFYEWGWGQSFHFSYKLPNETFDGASARHEYYIAGRLGVKEGDKVLDCGCGIGGPMRNIARFTRANITGVTLNDYQVQRGNKLNKEAGLEKTAKSVQADFMKLTESFEENSFDGCYAIEATCHAPKREGVYGEIFKCLKPGAVFATYEWCLTPKYDKDNEYHREIKKKIEEGDGLPDMAYQQECVDALKSVGFEVIEARDMALDERFGGDEWYLPLHPSWNPFSFRFQMTEVGKFFTRNMLWLLEGIWLVPAGTYKVQEMLQQGGWGCARGGVTGTFTPMWLMVARKPLK
jgi:sterol 24-C-methyltransferase